MELNHIPKVLVFLLVFLILGLIFFTVRDAVQTEKNAVFNFQPIPNQAPKFLPTPDMKLSCSAKLKSCILDDECQVACGSDFSCVTVEDGQNIVYNNIQVPDGSWCLPKLPKDKDCNIYTGRWTWSADPKCPNGQCWKCICKYPTLFTDSETGCLTQVGCMYQADQKSPPQLGSLVSSVFNTEYKSGEVKWDPTSYNPVVLSKNPMDTDDKSRPKWVCSCPPGTVRLPNDPYTCHPDKCCGSTEGCATTGILNQSFQCKTKNPQKISDDECAVGFTDPGLCECKCDCTYYQNTIYKNDQCFPSDNLCQPGSYDKNTGQCNCPGTAYNTYCYNLPDGIPAQPNNPTICKQKNNPINYQCWDVCNGNPCGNNAVPGTCGIDRSKNPPVHTCICSQKIEACGDSPVTVLPKNPKYPTCDPGDICLPSGTVVNTISSGTTTCNYDTRDIPCCSGDFRTESNFFGSTTYCK